MSFLFNKNNHFNLANIVTFFNIAAGIFAIYFLVNHPGSYTNIFAAITFPFMGLCTLINLWQDCPRCNRPFYGTSHFMGNTLRWNCRHCGLKRSGRNA